MLSSPKISFVALITGSTEAQFLSMSGRLRELRIRSADINLVGYNLVGALILSTFVNPNKLLIKNESNQCSQGN